MNKGWRVVSVRVWWGIYIERERERKDEGGFDSSKETGKGGLDESEALDLVMWGGSRMGVCHAEDLVK